MLAYGGINRDQGFSVTVMNDGDFVVSGSSLSNLTGLGIEDGSQDCSPFANSNGGMTSADCGFLIYYTTATNVSTLRLIKSNSSSVIRDTIEVGTTGELLITGSFQGNAVVVPNPQGLPNLLSHGQRDVMVLRVGDDMEWEYSTNFGGISNDDAFSITQMSGGYAVGGHTTSSSENPAFSSNSDGWIAAQGFGIQICLSFKQIKMGLFLMEKFGVVQAEIGYQIYHQPQAVKFYLLEKFNRRLQIQQQIIRSVTNTTDSGSLLHSQSTNKTRGIMLVMS